jgi:DNA-binding transcriptional regulator GbsR (MarR family)
MTHVPKHELGELRDRFIALWGRMASNWGIPRTMAEVHALLYIVGEPLNTDDVMVQLGISRGGASTALRHLQDWGIASRIHLRGDRKDYFIAEQDPGRLFRTILRERKKREIDPLIEALHSLREPAGVDADLARAHDERIDHLLEFVEMVDAISERLMSPTGRGLQLAAKLLVRAS